MYAQGKLICGCARKSFGRVINYILLFPSISPHSISSEILLSTFTGLSLMKNRTLKKAIKDIEEERQDRVKVKRHELIHFKIF